MSNEYKYEKSYMKAQLIVDIFEMHILYRNGCQKYYTHRKEIVNEVQKGGISYQDPNNWPIGIKFWN